MYILYGFFLIFWTNFAFTLGDCDAEKTIFVIRHTDSGLVVSGRYNVTLQYYSGNNFQQRWRFDRGDHAGLFYILNAVTGLVLAINNCDEEYCDVVEMAKSGALHEQWMINSDSKIWNAAQGQFLDISTNNFTPGSSLCTHRKEATSQGFSFIPVHF